MPFSMLPTGPAVGATVRAAARTVLPVGGESWGKKATRARRALRNAFVRRAEHDERLRRKDGSDG